MDNKTIRRLNLDGLIAEAGTIEALARKTSTDPNYLSQIRGGFREMGEDYARRIEAGLEKPVGWMDALQFSPAGGADELIRIRDSLSESDREAWITHGRLLMNKPPHEGQDGQGAE
jgi:hypothetical protein